LRMRFCFGDSALLVMTNVGATNQITFQAVSAPVVFCSAVLESLA